MKKLFVIALLALSAGMISYSASADTVRSPIWIDPIDPDDLLPPVKPVNPTPAPVETNPLREILEEEAECERRINGIERWFDVIEQNLDPDDRNCMIAIQSFNALVDQYNALCAPPRPALNRLNPYYYCNVWM